MVFHIAYLEALAVVFLASGLVAGAALAMHPLLRRQRGVLGLGRAGLRLESHCLNSACSSTKVLLCSLFQQPLQLQA